MGLMSMHPRPGIMKCRAFDESDANGREESNGDFNTSTMSMDDEV